MLLFVPSLKFCFAEISDQPRLDLNGMVPGEIRNVAFQNGTLLTDNLYAMGLPPLVRTTLLSFIEENGVMKTIREIKNNPMKENVTSDIAMNDGKWSIRRPGDHWNSDMHWISPAEKKTQLKFLKALGDGGFDDTLHAWGTALGMDGLVCYQLTIMAVTKCSEGYVHHDFEDTKGKSFAMLIPLLLNEDSEPELQVKDDATEEMVDLKYEYNTGILLGDEAYHATSAIDYTGTGKMRIMAIVYIADIRENNMEGIVEDLTQDYPPPDAERLLKSAGKHWVKPRHLPRSEDEEEDEEGEEEEGEEEGEEDAEEEQEGEENHDEVFEEGSVHEDYKSEL